MTRLDLIKFYRHSNPNMLHTPASHGKPYVLHEKVHHNTRIEYAEDIFLKRFTIVFCILCSLFISFPRISMAALTDDMLVFSTGYYDFMTKDDTAMDIRAGYRFKKTVLELFNPWLGVEATTDGALYGSGGFLMDIKLAGNWHVTPSLGAGLYLNGGGKDLGHAIQFRSQIEVSYQFENEHRLGLAVSHHSNARLGNHNPGTEILSLTYAIPLRCK